MLDKHDRYTSVIQQQAARFIAGEANTDPMITVTKVTTTPDYREVTIHITTLPEGREDDALIFLKRHGSALRQYLKKHAHLKYIPHLGFAIDYGERHRQHIDEIVRDTGTESTFDKE